MQPYPTLFFNSFHPPYTKLKLYPHKVSFLSFTKQMNFYDTNYGLLSKST